MDPLESGDDLRRYAVATQRRVMRVDVWLDRGWQQLPARRLEMAGDTEEPLQLQWACSEEGIASQLKAAGWQDAPAWSLRAALGSLAPHPAIQDLPVLPRFNRGDRSRLVFVRESAQQPDEREVLRLWRSEFELESGAARRPIWYGAVYREFRRGHGNVTQNLFRQSALPPDAFVPLLPTSVAREIRSLGSSQAQAVLVRCTDR